MISLSVYICAVNCEAKAKRGECETHAATTIFLCPKACNLCDAQGFFCSDLYLGKCKPAVPHLVCAVYIYIYIL